MSTDCLMPIVSSPKTRPDGTAFTINDKEYWELIGNGGIRRHQHFAFPAMRYRAVDDGTGRAQILDRIVGNEREDDDAKRAGWYPTPADAKDAFEGSARAIAQAAAEAQAAATRMSEKAQAERARRSASTDKHLTE
jgi:hypothetical protein